VIEVAFQSAFHLEMNQNNIFLFLKFTFDINTSKQSKNTKKNLKLKKSSKIFKSVVGTTMSNKTLYCKSRQMQRLEVDLNRLIECMVKSKHWSAMRNMLTNTLNQN
jgi:hypothetical protein